MIQSTTLYQLVPDNFSTISCVLAGLVAVVVIAKLSQRPNLSSIPTVGSTSWLGSWWAGLKYLTNAGKIIQEGYHQHKPAPFKVATPFYWVVVLSSRAHLDELRNLDEDVFSFLAAANEDFNLEYMMGRDIQQNPFHIQAIRSQLTRNLGALFPEIYDEVVVAFDELLDLQGNEWRSMPALDTIQKVVCRASNRLFVGLPLCRNADYIDLNVRWTIDAASAGAAIGLFPKFLRPLAVHLLTSIPAGTRRGVNHISPLVEARRKSLDIYGKEWADKPNDFLSWMMDMEEGRDLSPERLAQRIVAINFAAIHTSSNSFAGVLFNLAAHPECVKPLRDEVEAIVDHEGWSKASINKMHKIDSFLKECLRIEGIDLLSMARKAMKDYTFSDGLFIPKGTRIAAASRSLQFDEANYANPTEFDPFRFSNMRREDEINAKSQYTTTAVEYLPFGYGKHACPGRFFAANELKIMLAHIVMTYDVKLEGNPPRSLYIGNIITANHAVKVMFRKRGNKM